MMILILKDKGIKKNYNLSVCMKNDKETKDRGKIGEIVQKIIR